MNQPLRLRILILALVLAAPACTTLPRQYQIADAPQSTPHQGSLDLNKASSLELEQLPGIGKALADRIVAHREKFGPFRRAEHLIMVRGMSETRFREISAQVFVR